RYQFGDRENHVAGRAALPGFAVYGQPHRQLLRVGYFVARRKVWTERRESVGALALEALAAAVELEVAFGEVDADAIAKHVIERLPLRDVHASPANHDSKLDLPVDAPGLARHHEIVGGTAERAGCFQEQRRLLRQRQPGFLRVIAIVQAD